MTQVSQKILRLFYGHSILTVISVVEKTGVWFPVKPICSQLNWILGSTVTVVDLGLGGPRQG